MRLGQGDRLGGGLGLAPPAPARHVRGEACADLPGWPAQRPGDYGGGAGDEPAAAREPATDPGRARLALPARPEPAGRAVAPRAARPRPSWLARADVPAAGPRDVPAERAGERTPASACGPAERSGERPVPATCRTPERPGERTPASAGRSPERMESPSARPAAARWLASAGWPAAAASRPGGCPVPGAGRGALPALLDPRPAAPVRAVEVLAQMRQEPDHHQHDDDHRADEDVADRSRLADRVDQDREAD